MEFDKDKYKVMKLPHPMLLHWIINPGLAFNELVLGQRIPKVTLVDKTSDAPLMERQYIPCPECNALHDGRLWSKGNSFGHWFGYICPKCHGKIPCLWNITSLILLALTFPIWIWFEGPVERIWFKREIKRFSGVVPSEPAEVKKTNWLSLGLGWGIIMFCVMVLPKVFQGKLDSVAITIQATIWLCGGLIFGYVMKLLLGSRKNN